MAALKESRDALTRQAHPPSRGAEEPKDRRSRGPEGDHSRLEGSPPGRFKGDREKSSQFLIRFNLFMMINQCATIARNPIRRCAYFLSLVHGPKVKSWAEKSYDWLDQIEADPTVLPHGMTAWQVLTADFRREFIEVNYAERVCALDELEKLEMTEGRVDEYIAEFERLAHRAGIGLDDPINLLIFARGLPRNWASACISKDDPKSFEQWSEAARRQEKIWFKKRALKSDYGTAQTNTGGQNQNQRRGQFFWRHASSEQCYGCSNSNSNPARPRIPPRNDSTTVTSATIRKASTEREREEYRKAGRCFECGKHGHLARNCRCKTAPSKPRNKIPQSI